MTLNDTPEPNAEAWAWRILLVFAMFGDLAFYAITLTTFNPGFTLETAKRLSAARFKARIPPNRRL